MLGLPIQECCHHHSGLDSQKLSCFLNNIICFSAYTATHTHSLPHTLISNIPLYAHTFPQVHVHTAVHMFVHSYTPETQWIQLLFLLLLLRSQCLHWCWENPGGSSVCAATASFLSYSLFFLCLPNCGQLNNVLVLKPGTCECPLRGRRDLADIGKDHSWVYYPHGFRLPNDVTKMLWRRRPWGQHLRSWRETVHDGEMPTGGRGGGCKPRTQAYNGSPTRSWETRNGLLPRAPQPSRHEPMKPILNFHPPELRVISLHDFKSLCLCQLLVAATKIKMSIVL